MTRVDFATLPEALAHWARETPARRLFSDGTMSLTYGATAERITRLAGGFGSLGLVPGDRIAVLMQSGIDYALVWLAAAQAGLVAAYINPAHIGEILAHQLRLADPKMLIADRGVWQNVDAAWPTYGGRRVVAGEASGPEVSLHTLLQAEPGAAGGPRPSDPMALYFTSGTTGPSKAVLYGHAQAMATARPMAAVLDRDDVFLWFNPMFHVALPHFVGASMIAGASVEIVPAFSARNFWHDVRQRKATAAMMLGAVASLVAAQPERPADREHGLRKVFMVPLQDRLQEFERRFEVRTMSWFNMTEVATPIHTRGFDRTDDVSCGYVREGVEARIVDELDQPVPDGVAGELTLRYARPFEFSQGYWGDPVSTVAAWRNLWFHTGDVFARAPDGGFRFVDRRKDVIRRRGENIAASEVERAINAHPAVLESAVVGVPSPLGEEDVLAVIVPAAGTVLVPEEVIAYLQTRLAAYMVPRYVRIDARGLPKTPTGKVQKGPLRAAGIAGSWDRGDRTNAGL